MRILLVEDERKISAYVKRGLVEQGYAVDAAYTGQEALDWPIIELVSMTGFILLGMLLSTLLSTRRLARIKVVEALREL